MAGGVEEQLVTMKELLVVSLIVWHSPNLDVEGIVLINDDRLLI